MAYEIQSEPVTIWPEGSRLPGIVMKPKGAPSPTPAILLCHGWGGMKEHLIQLYADAFVGGGIPAWRSTIAAGRERRLIAAKDTPSLLTVGEAMLKVRVLREIVDPVDQIADIRACLAWLLTEDGVDPARVGLWGSSYCGGHVTFVGGTDARVKAIVAQIGGYEHPREDWYRDLAHKRMADKARTLIDPPVPQGVDGSPGLRGTPDIARQWGHSPLKGAETVRAPILFIDAEFEEYNEPALQGSAAQAIVKANGVTTERVTFPCTHYKVYDEYLVAARQLALDWFDKYL